MNITIIRIDTIKDPQNTGMSRHDQDLTDMHELLQQMKDMHQELQAPDHLEFSFKSVFNHAKTKLSNMVHGKVSEETVLTTFFERKDDEERKSFLTTLVSSAKQQLDLYRALKNLITESNEKKAGKKYMLIDENSFKHNDTKTTVLTAMMKEAIENTDAKIIFKKLITYVDLKDEILKTYNSVIEPVKNELQATKDAKKSSNTPAQTTNSD
jgi:hypothetical protein